MRRFANHLSFSNVISVLALFVALGGGAYAAVSSIPGPDGVIRGCYQKSKGTLRVIKSGQKCQKKSELAISWNQKGVPGTTGQAGPQGITGSQGQPGTNGKDGANFTATATLPSGQTETGVWGMLVNTPSTPTPFGHAVSFTIPLTGGLDSNHVVYVPTNGSSAFCPGDGQALPGYLCVYEHYRTGNVNDPVPASNNAIYNLANNGSGGNLGADKHGFQLVFGAQSSAFAMINGTWSVTAP